MHALMLWCRATGGPCGFLVAYLGTPSRPWHRCKVTFFDLLPFCSVALSWHVRARPHRHAALVHLYHRILCTFFLLVKVLTPPPPRMLPSKQLSSKNESDAWPTERPHQPKPASTRRPSPPARRPNAMLFKSLSSTGVVGSAPPPPGAAEPGAGGTPPFHPPTSDGSSGEKSAGLPGRGLHRLHAPPTASGDGAGSGSGE